MRKSSLVMPDSFINKLKAKWDEGKFVCVGLDSDYDKIPNFWKTKQESDTIAAFNRDIIEATYKLVCAYKLNTAFYEALGSEGIRALQHTVHHIEANHPKIPIILDGKRGDIGNTNEGYAKFAFEVLRVDAVTVQPYLGKIALEPFLKYGDKGIFVLIRTSNPGSDEIQNLKVEGIPLYQVLARNVAEKWNTKGNCGVVVGATFPEELKKVRKIVGDIPILIPGIGYQGGDLTSAVKNGITKNKDGIIINSSRGIIFASNGLEAAEAARKEAEILHGRIQEILKNV